jgi:DNA-binding NarL/FixJ family response regulator
MDAISKLAGNELDPDACAALDSSAAQRHVVRPRNPGNLTDRELEVLRLVSAGQSNRQIATTLVVSPKTVEHHVEHIFNKLGVSSRTAAGVFAVHNGLAP